MKLSFRARDISAPVIVLVLAIALTFLFSFLLPLELAYNFKGGAALDKLTGRSTFLAWTLIPQFCLVLLAAVIVWGTIRISRRFPRGESPAVKKLLTIMGNMLALPQLILLFAMLDVFLYNLYGIHVMPLWLFAALVMLAGIIILGAIFVQAVQQARQAS